MELDTKTIAQKIIEAGADETKLGVDNLFNLDMVQDDQFKELIESQKNSKETSKEMLKSLGQLLAISLSLEIFFLAGIFSIKKDTAAVHILFISASVIFGFVSLLIILVSLYSLEGILSNKKLIKGLETNGDLKILDITQVETKEQKDLELMRSYKHSFSLYRNGFTYRFNGNNEEIKDGKIVFDINKETCEIDAITIILPITCYTLKTENGYTSRNNQYQKGTVKLNFRY
jgi:hypothetical protein